MSNNKASKIRDLSTPGLQKHGHPGYVDYAILLDGHQLRQSATLDHKDIENFLRNFLYDSNGTPLGKIKLPAAGTITRILNGKRGNYLYVHFIFTAINYKSRNMFIRKNYVINAPNRNRKASETIDANLAYSATFPRLKKIVRDLIKNNPRLGDEHDIIRDIGNNSVVSYENELEVLGYSPNLKVGELKSVRTFYVERMFDGYPVRKDKIDSVFNTVSKIYKNEKGETLHYDDEIIL